MTVRSEAQSIQKGVRCTYMFNTRNERDNLERSCFEFIVVCLYNVSGVHKKSFGSIAA